MPPQNLATFLSNISYSTKLLRDLMQIDAQFWDAQNYAFKKLLPSFRCFGITTSTRRNYYSAMFPSHILGFVLHF